MSVENKIKELKSKAVSIAKTNNGLEDKIINRFVELHDNFFCEFMPIQNKPFSVTFLVYLGEDFVFNIITDPKYNRNVTFTISKGDKKIFICKVEYKQNQKTFQGMPSSGISDFHDLKNIDDNWETILDRLINILR